MRYINPCFTYLITVIDFVYLHDSPAPAGYLPSFISVCLPDYSESCGRMFVKVSYKEETSIFVDFWADSGIK